MNRSAFTNTFPIAFHESFGRTNTFAVRARKELNFQEWKLMMELVLNIMYTTVVVDYYFHS